MALTLASALSVKQKSLSDTRNASSQSLLRTFFSYWSQHKQNGDLQFVAITGLSSADLVIADVACKLHVLFLRKPDGSTVDAWFKGSNHATTAAANGDIVVFLVGTDGENQEVCQVYPDGLKLSTGLTVASHTTVNGATDSALADAPVGFAIIGAA